MNFQVINEKPGVRVPAMAVQYSFLGLFVAAPGESFKTHQNATNRKINPVQLER